MTTVRTIAITALALLVLLVGVALSVQAAEDTRGTVRSGANAAAWIDDGVGGDGRPPRPSPTDPNGPSI
jgi:hypothetical protein